MKIKLAGLIGLGIFGLGILLGSCSIFGGNTNVDQPATIPLPPQKISESDAVMPILPDSHSTTTNQSESGSMTKINNVIPEGRTIETRSDGGTVESIKVNNGNNLPAYYITPNNQDNDSQSGNNVAPATWKVSY